MSTILKALRRLEHEKSAQEGRPLRDEVAAVPAHAGSRRLPWLALGACALALGLGMGATMVWLSSRGEPTASSAVEPAPAVAQAPQHSPRRAGVTRTRTPGEPPRPALVVPAPEPQAAVAAAPPPGEGETPEAAAAPQIDAMVAPLAEAAPAPEPAPMPEAAPMPRAASPEPPPVALVKRPTPAKAAPPKLAVSKPAAPVEEAPKPGDLPPFETKPRAVEDTPAPTKQTASAKPVVKAPPPPPRASSPETVARPNVPDVKVWRTVWHPRSERRIAMVALDGGAARELHEGDAIGSLVVSTIEPSGVVFLHEGVELRRRVGAKN